MTLMMMMLQLEGGVVLCVEVCGEKRGNAVQI